MLKRNCHCIVSKAYLEFLKKQENPGPIDRLSTIAHEFFHWKDAQEYIGKNGRITNQEEHING